MLERQRGGGAPIAATRGCGASPQQKEQPWSIWQEANLGKRQHTSIIVGLGLGTLLEWCATPRAAALCATDWGVGVWWPADC